MSRDTLHSLPPCVLYEDEHLLVVNKPGGWNTHAPSPFAGEGIYDWLKHREPRWASLAIVHRLDKETSGVMVFGKTPLANRSLTEKFASRTVRKKYLLLTDREPKQQQFTVKSRILRLGDRYASGAQGEPAETHFRVINTSGRKSLIEAEPLTGRTHQIRVHAADSGIPILGDALYGGTAAPVMYLQADSISFNHPATNQEVSFKAWRSWADLSGRMHLGLHAAIIAVEHTHAYRQIHGASDGWPNWYLDRLDAFLYSQSPGKLTPSQKDYLASIPGTKAVYHKTITRHVRSAGGAECLPELVLGEAAPERFSIRENDVKYELSFSEGYSVGLFLDQRDNRRRLITGHVAADFPLFKSEIRNPKPDVLNCFAYTCGFSVCAALGGARTTSLDLSKKYLEWGKRNFALNGLDPTQHDFIYGDTFDWLKRLAKKQRAFDVVLLDPPTFSRSKQGGVFRAEKDYGKLVSAALPVVKPGGVLFASTNAAEWPPEDFLAEVKRAVHGARRKIVEQHYAPQPPDFPVSRAEPAYLKTVWMRVAG